MQEINSQLRFFCPACGSGCTIEGDDEDGFECQCPQGHRWSLTINWHSDRSDDGTEIFGFACAGTHAAEMYHREE